MTERKRHTARDIPRLGKGIHCFDPTLYLRVQGTGARSWIQRITINGKQVDRGLGGADLVSLGDARLAALSNRRAARAGRDPFAARDAARTAVSAPTFGDAAERLMDTLSGKAATTIKTYRSVLNNLSRLTDRPVASITRAEVIGALKGIASPSARGKAIKIVRRVLDRAVVLEWAPGNVADNGGLAAAVDVTAAAPSHHAAAPHVECPAIFGRLTAAGTAAADALAFIMLTAARLTEATGAAWTEFDLDAATWTVPADRMKAGRPHRVPLSDAALAVLERARALDDGSGLVFPSPLRAGHPLSDMSLTKLLRDRGLADRATVHGFRSAFRDWCADAGTPREVAEAALAHAVGGVEGAYFRSDLLERRRALMDAWAAFLKGPR